MSFNITNSYNYYDKYIKYKTKYLKLKNMKGGMLLDKCSFDGVQDKDIPIINYTIINMGNYFTNYYPCGGFNINETLTNGVKPAIFNLNYNIETKNNGTNNYIKIIKFNYLYKNDIKILTATEKRKKDFSKQVLETTKKTKLKKVNRTKGQNTKNQSDNSNIIPSDNNTINDIEETNTDIKITNQKEYILDLENILEEIVEVYAHNNTDFIYSSILSYSEKYFPVRSIFSSIIGKNLNLKCDSIVEDFLDNVSGINVVPGVPEKKIIIMDFANVVSILHDIKNFTFDQIKKYFNNFIFNICEKQSNYLFIIFKPSSYFDINFLQDALSGKIGSPDTTNLLHLIGNSNSFLHIICCGFGSINSDTEKKPEIIDINKGYWGKNNIQLFNGQIQSSIDDLIFWIFIVFIYNIIITKNRNFKIENLILLTNDGQSFDTDKCSYYNDVTNLLIPSNCGKKSTGTGGKIEYNSPQKNLFNIIFPEKCTNDKINSDYNIFLYSIMYTNKDIYIDGEKINADTLYKAHDSLLNRYINFVYNLFANTPLKLDPNLLIWYRTLRQSPEVKKLLIRDYRKNIDFCIIPNKNLKYNFDNTLDDLGNMDIYYNIFETFLTNNINISQIRTDALYFLLEKYPFQFLSLQKKDNFGGPLKKINFIDHTNKKFENVHPGLFFYFQIKIIQNNKKKEKLTQDELTRFITTLKI